MAMIRRSMQAGFLVAGLLLASSAEARPQLRNPAAAQRRKLALPPGSATRTPAQSRGAQLPPEWLEQLQEMRPAEQQRFLKNNERFLSLPPEQQNVIRRRLKAWNNLPAEQRQALLERQQIWEQLPPQQRQQVRQSLLPRWQSMPPPRRQAIMAKLRELRGLDTTQRSAKLNDENFLSSLSPDERQMLRDLSTLGVDQAAQTPQNAG